MSEYVIVGDTKNYFGCLVMVCKGDRDFAEKVLQRMLSNPTQNDKRCMKGHTNLRIEEVEEKDCWWNDPFLVN
ncbi:MAG: hypothetical protein II453_17910 [Alphaproteobacteria bacterium]|nr:hypothetical protein [Alphaproteobacteria bacterium]